MRKLSKADDKIIFVVIHPYALRDHRRFGVQYLLEQGYDVEVWRIITGRSIQMEWSAGMYTGRGYREYSKNAYKKAVKNNRRGSIFVFMSKSTPLYYAAMKGCTYVIMDALGPVPVPQPDSAYLVTKPQKTGFAARIRKTFSTGIRREIGRRIYNRIRPVVWRHVLKSAPPLVIVTSTEYAAKRYLSPLEREMNLLFTHSLDYDRYVETERSTGPREQKHIVYCDGQLFTRGYDFRRFDMTTDAVAHADEYHLQLIRLFEKLEEHYNLPVVIAGSPHAEYENGKFCGRDVIFDKTCALTKDAAAFIITASTAMNFAVIYDTPVMKIANRFLKTSPLGHYSSTYMLIKDETEQIFGCGFLDLDDEEEMEHPWDYIKKIPKERRDDLMRDYVIDNDTTDSTIIECLEKYLTE